MEERNRSNDDLLREIKKLNNKIIKFEKREVYHRSIAKDLILRSAWFEQLFKNISHGIAILDPEDKIVSINKAFEDMFNFMPEEIYGKLLNEVLVPKELYHESSGLSAVTFEGKIADKESVRKRKDGTLVNVRILGVPINIDGQIRSIFAIYENITDRINNEKAKLQEAELRARTAELYAQVIESQKLTAEAEAKAIQAENARKTAELDEARKIQISMLPKHLPEIPCLDISVYMKTAQEVGGDYYDFITFGNDELVIAIGDATGHGLRAGSMVTIIKSLFYADAAEMDIVPFFEKCTSNIKKMQLSNLYMGLTLAKVKGHEMIISSAGMPPVYLFKSNEKIIEKIVFKSMPLGAFSNYEYTTKKFHFEKGDSLLFLTDGLPELFNDENTMLDYAPIEDLFLLSGSESTDVIIDRLIKIGENWNNGKNQNDDITFIVLKIKE